MLTSNELRQKYMEFFKSKEHTVIPSASLIPENDPTVLFTTAGMHPLVPYLLGQVHPGGARVTSLQKCIRTVDIDGVGDNSHLTFFEMLGNWSFGDYWKKEAIEWSWEFLTSPQYLNIDKRKISVTIFGGDDRFPQIPKDDEAAKIWKSVGVPDDKIAYMPGGVLEREDNWWGPAGQTGPCGPSTEMFYWQGPTEFPPAGSNVSTDKANWLEIWNDVFMQYKKVDDKNFEPLQKKNVDTGMGMDRTIRILNGFIDIFQIDTLWPLIQKIEEVCGREYIENSEVTRSMRIIADHMRAATMIMGDKRGVAPSNVDQGYIVRRLIRRSIRHGRTIGISKNFCSSISEKVIELFKDVYPEVWKNKDFVLTEVTKEESKFRNTIELGIKNYELRIKDLKGNIFPAKEAFDLYQSYGFPIEITIELAKEKGLEVDVKGFEEEMKKHQDLSRAGAKEKFKGGLADHGDISVKYHTATHLLHAALRKVLGEHVAQKGSNITAERLRFDFSHPEKMTEDQKRQVEDLVNAAIGKDYQVSWEEKTVKDAKKSGAIGLFESKYGEKVKVYSVGDPNGSPVADPSKPTFSKEICGGPHVEHTGALGKFRIVKEEAVSSGVRRIKAVLE